MNEALRQKLAQRVSRRSFLKGSSLAALGIVSTTVSSPTPSFAQNPKPKDPDNPSDKDSKDETVKDGKEPNKDGTDESVPDPYKVTHRDEKGDEYRVCPVCGSNMYRQDRTWTCENCGYSYEE